MMRCAGLAALLLAGPAAAETVDVPSGQPVELAEVIREAHGPKGVTLRFRFVAPRIAGGEDKLPFAEVAADMDFLCSGYALSHLPAPGPRPDRIIISLAAAPVEFGDIRPEITQFFEAYEIDGDACIWEGI
ncbi:DUF6497 family protein [Psychromarinibacter sp. C21-152]|uniref:DUF6497 family protein n=1 Tax=Psychromarinibacter sediminicola TaxID=3033385 RepID=A0AAE3NS24_9RHOB|nr:DUF6497 family protein [Psychromarinibacter sediminicola]MDF0600584.1 DUF6497 family protein [Psychromarinibacter sediminicola]